MKKLNLGISTCPNDTFVFDALVNGRIDRMGLNFECHLTDVEDLNNKAFRAEYDITKLSYHAYAYVSDDYILLNSGSALGYNNGPLLVAAEPSVPGQLEGKTIAIPGKYTTANLLLSIFFPYLNDRREYLFSDIEDMVLKGEAGAGLLIHENRFTYSDRGLYKVSDLGELWHDQTGMPIPLGGIAVKRELGKKIAEKIDRILAASIEFACNNPDVSYDFVSQYAASMEKDVMKKHIDLYVNDFSRDIGITGREAVKVLYNKAYAMGIIPSPAKELFVPTC